jgi:hypothetical protein
MLLNIGAIKTPEQLEAEHAVIANIWQNILPDGPRAVSPSSISSPKHSLLSSTYAGGGGDRLPVLHNIMTGQPFLEKGRA